MSAPTTIRTEGGLLPPDFLQRLTGLQADVPGLTPDSYHLAGEKLHEAASRAWNRLLGVWTAFQAAAEQLPSSDPATTVTREKWLLPLFAELGYGRLQPARAIEVDGKSYPVSHAWQQVPVHLVGRNVDLDRRTPGVAGAARTSPHGLVQELLNRRHESLWGFVSNGLKLRLLRDNRSLTRQAYVEFDLAAMMDGQAFSDFVLLWLLCHQSRVEGDPPETCWLEKWATAAREHGTRALDELRDGVERAIEALGRGFLKHSANGALLDRLRRGAIDRQDYYRQLLRVVYRLIFLFVAEARELLLVAEPASAAAQRYRRYYSVMRLRELAGQRRGTPHGDLWQALLVVFRGLSSDRGCPELGLPALGSLLWSDAAAPDLDTCQLANADLLEAIRALAFRVERGLRRVVDWRNLGPEELGSVYESLLELHPELNTASATFSLRDAAGHERKTTGSYYTPTSLVECLLDSALDPVLDQAARAENPERAILDLKICDPACGSGHFLIAAAHRVAKRLAAVRTGDAEPSPEAVRTALRDVIGHCVYGVDVNPMAVELCKVNLWLEALCPGRPLSFLDHHIQCGNSLLGATPALLRGGIPNAAFDPIEGDDRVYCRELKRRNRREREGFRNLFTGEPWERLGDLATGLANLDEIDDSTLDGVRQKELRYAEIVRSTGYAHGRLWADAWCAAFVWPKTREAHPLTEDLFRTIERNPMAAPEAVRREVQRIAEEYRFFHWHLAYPDVFRVPAADQPLAEGPGWIGGFDVVLGNPPWEQFEFDPAHFFASRDPEILDAPHMAERDRRIAALLADPSNEFIRQGYFRALRQNAAYQHFIHSSGRFPLSSEGRLNTAPLFIETVRMLATESKSRVGLIVPTTFAVGSFTQRFFRELMATGELRAFYAFDNSEGLFPAVKRSFRFGLMILSREGRGPDDPADFVFFATRLSDLADRERHYFATAKDMFAVNPNTGTCAVFRSSRDARLTIGIHKRLPVLSLEHEGSSNPWLFDSMLMFMTNHLSRHYTEPNDHVLPVHEAKACAPYDHRRLLPDFQKEDPRTTAPPRYWVPANLVYDRLRGRWSREWLLAWQDVTDVNTMSRTLQAMVLPLGACGDGLPVLISGVDVYDLAGLVAALNAYVVDFVARQKVGGTHMRLHTFKQLPVPPPSVFARQAPWSMGTVLRQWLGHRVLELTCTAWDIASFGRDLGWTGAPFRWHPVRRFLLRCELDAAFFHLYGIARDDVDYIMETFPIVRRSDEAAYGEYRTKRVILEIYDRMQRAIDTGVAYQTVLEPPPADPRVAHDAVTVPTRAVAVATTPAASKLIALEEERVLRRVIAKRADRYRTCVPLIDLKIAAGSFGDDQEPEFDSWVEIKASGPLQRGMFVAQVTGRSMEPLIPDGAFCLFQRKAPALRDGMIAAVQLHGLEDPEHGGRYTVKKLAVTTERDPATGEMRRRTILEPLNPECRPLVVSDESGDIRLVAEFVEVLAELAPPEAVEG